MSVVVGIGLSIIFIVVCLWPLLQMWEHLLFPSQLQHRLEEYKRLAYKLAATEHIMLEVINAARTKHCQLPAYEQSVLEYLAVRPQGRGIVGFLRICRNKMREALRQMKWGS